MDSIAGIIGTALAWILAVPILLLSGFVLWEEGYYLITFGLCLIAFGITFCFMATIIMYRDRNMRDYYNQLGPRYRKALFSGNFPEAWLYLKMGWSKGFKKDGVNNAYATLNLAGLSASLMGIVLTTVTVMPHV